MKISKLIEILAQYMQEHGDIEFKYADKELNIFDVGEMDLNIQLLVKKKVLALETKLKEDTEGV